MRAFILAAGEGRRLRPLTERVPKPMIEVRGRPILEHNVRLLVRAGVRDITINTHYLPDVVTTNFDDGKKFGARISYSHETELLGTAGALNAVRDRFEETFVVVYGDNLTTCDLSRLIEVHRSGQATATIAVYARDDVSQSGVVVLDGDDRVLRFVEKPQAEERLGHWVNAGLLVLEPSIFRYIPSEGFSDFGRDVFPAALAAGDRIQAYRMTEHLWWIDSLADYERTVRDPATGLLEYR
jgi:NDP-sugar pyrophosphorylase family protein